MRIVTLTSVLALTACASSMYPPAMVSDLAEDRVVIQAGAWNEDAEIQQLASDGCAIHGRSASGPVTRHYTGALRPWAFLFACTED